MDITEAAGDLASRLFGTRLANRQGMNLKTLLTKPRLVRLSGAALAAAVVTFVGLYPAPFAKGETSGCSLQDVGIWRAELTDPSAEIDPDYILRVTGAFLQRCPDRPEVKEAHRLSGLAANDKGDTRLAVTHFEQAGYLPDAWAKFAYAAALLAEGEDDQAWMMRDMLVADWLRKLKRRPDADIVSVEVPGGMVHHLKVTPRGQNEVVLAWTAVPDGAGWPATLSAGPDRQLLAFRQMRAGSEAQQKSVIDLYRCRGRRVLAELDGALPDETFNSTAIAAMTAYLANPDPSVTLSGPQPLAMCLWPSRLLPVPSQAR